MFPRKATPFLILLLLAAFPAGLADDTMSTETRELTYQIQTTWDDRPVDHDPVIVSLACRGSEGVEIKVDAPFFGVPGNPGGEPGKPFDKLWEHEVVEVFFADGDANQPKYLEVELSPWGQHLVLMLDGAKNAIRTLLPIEYTAEINGNRWTGRAIIPSAYFPPKVTRFNAYAIHDVVGVEGDPRRYEALFPVPHGKYPAADFHRLDYFRPLNFELLQPGNNVACLSEEWSSYTPQTFGQYDVQLYSLPYHMISRGHRVDVNITAPSAGHWTAQATIPLALLPANINKCTVASVYTMGNEIQYEACYHLENGGISLPDLMVLDKYADVNTLFSPGVNDAYSDLWNEDN